MKDKEALAALQFLKKTFRDCDFGGTNSTELWDHLEDSVRKKQSFWKLVFSRRKKEKKS